jgi:peptide chain release factor 2
LASSRAGGLAYNSTSRSRRRPDQTDQEQFKAWKKNTSIARRQFARAFSNCETLFDWEAKKARIAAIDAESAAPGFWDNPERVQATMDERKALSSVVTPLENALKESDDLNAAIELADDDESIAAEVPDRVAGLETIVEQLKLKALLNGPHDAAGAILSINARDGGTDANDWAEMLLRMYTLWAQKTGYSVELLERQDSEQAGISHAAIAVRGPMAYGYLKGETGMHRLVRISPFNAEGKRQTSFAAIDVSPEVSDTAEIEINPEDVREDTFRASGAGGQHVNKTSSAIRLTHAPSGIVVQCQSERSQHKNRATAWKMLRARMARQEEEKREAAEAAKYQQQAKVGFGSQIRNYFLHPDQRVKDARTKYQQGNFHAVMDGDIQGFLDSVLRWRAGQPVADDDE